MIIVAPVAIGVVLLVSAAYLSLTSARRRPGLRIVARIAAALAIVLLVGAAVALAAIAAGSSRAG